MPQGNKWEEVVDAVQVLNFSKLTKGQGQGWKPILTQMATLTLILKAKMSESKLVAGKAEKQDQMKTAEAVFEGAVWAVDVVAGQ